MTVNELLDFDAQKRSIDQMRTAARYKTKHVKAMQASFRLQKARQQLIDAQKAVAATANN